MTNGAAAPGPWSDVRREHMSVLEMRRYREVAGLEPEDAVVWWEHYVFPAEAKAAIAAGVDLETAREDALRRRRELMSAEMALSEVERDRELARRAQDLAHVVEQARPRANQEMKALSARCAALLGRVTAVRLGEHRRLVRLEPGIFSEAWNETDAGSDADRPPGLANTLAELLDVALADGLTALGIYDLTPEEAAELLSDPVYWPQTLDLCSMGTDDSLGLNGRAFVAREGRLCRRSCGRLQDARQAPPETHLHASPQCDVEVRWDDGTSNVWPIERLNELTDRAIPSGLDIVALDTGCTDLPSLLAVVSRCISEANDEVALNGHDLVWASMPDEQPCLVPTPDAPGVITHFYSDASWLPGGPVVFDQNEGIYSLSDLYWVRSTGDSVNECICVGRHARLEDGLAAAIGASTFYSLENGEVFCELDDWPNDE